MAECVVATTDSQLPQRGSTVVQAAFGEEKASPLRVVREPINLSFAKLRLTSH